MSRYPTFLFLLAVPFLSSQAMSAHVTPAETSLGNVYVLSNDPAGNSVIVFHRSASGALSLKGTFPTGGNGAGSGADPLGSENPVVLSKDGHLLLAVNAGSNSISAFKVSGDRLTLASTVDSGGTLPVSVSMQKRLVYVLNAGGTPNVSGFTIDTKTDALTPLAGSIQALPGGPSSAPAEVSFGPNEHVLVVTETATNQIDSFVLNSAGVAQPGVAFPSTVDTPFGFAFGHDRVAVISDAADGTPGASALSSYAVAKDGTVSAITAGVGDTQTAACWVAVTKNGTFAYIANTGSGTISSYSISDSGALSLLNAAAGSANVPVDIGLTHNSQFLYARNAGDGTVSGFRVGDDGSLKQVASAGGLPAGAAGLAAH